GRNSTLYVGGFQKTQVLCHSHQRDIPPRFHPKHWHTHQHFLPLLSTRVVALEARKCKGSRWQVECHCRRCCLPDEDANRNAIDLGHHIADLQRALVRSNGRPGLLFAHTICCKFRIRDRRNVARLNKWHVGICSG